MEKIVVTRKIPGIALEWTNRQLPGDWEIWINPSEFPLTHSQLIAHAHDATALLVCGDVITDEIMALLPRLRVLSNYGVGLDNIDLEAAKRRGIIVMNTPDEVTYSTAELAITLMLACMRRIGEADQLVRSHNPIPWTPTIVIGRNLRNKTLGIVGFGRIGQKVAQMAQAFDLNVIYYSRTRKPEAEQRLNAHYCELHQLLATADIVSLHVPGGLATHHLIGAEQLRLMKSDAVLINVARGTVVDEQALVRALATGQIAAAGLDVYEKEPYITEELAKLPNVVLTPHIGTTTWETRLAMTERAFQNICEVLLTAVSH